MRRPVAIAVALLIGLPAAARAQWSEGDPSPSNDGRWGEGTWSGDDESEWSAPSPGDPRDGYAPPDEYAGRGDDERDGSSGFRDDEGRGEHEGRYSDERSREHDRGDDDDRRYDSRERVGPSMRDFRTGLGPHGRWVDTPEYGVVWQPTHVSHGWRPYWDGRWVYTSAGWTWVTDEPWGWATYHYGRWANVGGMGWVWLPGQVWAPAWVAWRWGEGVAGWCPLGPRGVVYEQPHFWVFVQSTRFLEPIRRVAVPVVDVRIYYARARLLPMYRPGPYAGPARRIVEVETRRTVRPVPIVEARTPATSALPSGAVQVWRPRTAPIAHTVQPARRADVPRGSQPIVQPASPAQHQPAPRAWGATVPQLSPRTGSGGSDAAPVPRTAQPQVAPRATPQPQPAPRTAPAAQPQLAPRPVAPAQVQQGPVTRNLAPARRLEPAAEPRSEHARPPAQAARPVAETRANIAPRRPQQVVERAHRSEARAEEPRGGGGARPVAPPRAGSAAIVRVDRKKQ